MTEEAGWFESQTIPFSGKEWLMIRKAIKGTGKQRDKTEGPHFDWLGVGGRQGTSIGERMDILISSYDPKNPRRGYVQCNARSKPIPGKLRWRKEAAQADVPRVIVKQAGERRTKGKKSKDDYVEGARQKRSYRENIS